MGRMAGSSDCFGALWGEKYHYELKVMLPFNVGQRVRLAAIRSKLRGTVLSIHLPTTFKKDLVPLYIVKMDNGATLEGSKYQFDPVRKT